MTTPEGRVKEKVKQLLRKYKVYYHMPVMNGMGAPTLDFVCSAWGYYLAIETKAPKEFPTPRQLLTMTEISESGGFVFVVRDDETLAVLEAFLEIMEPCQKKNLRLGLRVVGPTTTTTTFSARSAKSTKRSRSRSSTATTKEPIV